MTGGGARLKVQNAILCEDVRREEGTNKAILIGVYSGDIGMPELPAIIQLALYIEVIASAGHHVAELRISGPQKGAEQTLSATVESDNDGTPTVIATPRFHLKFTSEGTFKVEGRIDDGPWIKIIKKPVKLRPTKR